MVTELRARVDPARTRKATLAIRADTRAIALPYDRLRDVLKPYGYLAGG